MIEAFGVYWHKEHEEAERKALFSRYGYKTLVIWERTSNNPLRRLPFEDEVVKQVASFLG